ncbi:hypothetical protein QWY86_19100 [Pedobacter aquatilis]|uniref:hypothetical protein n=1 Tax=Pedobacter aquatilis TaxID=351343 RepID=UPI0025B5D7F2|nr:hypothetical protein [Pedobacter aquatilis]MDN3588797.1 hypothetical protein [Pedobacter aquatilis]
MIQLMYLHADANEELGYQSYLIVQQENNKPYMILKDDEIIGELEFVKDTWTGSVLSPLKQSYIQDIGKFISQQAFYRLPSQILARGSEYVKDIVVVSEAEIMVICLPDVDFNAFRRLFNIFVKNIMQQNDIMNFKVFDSNFEHDFSLEIQITATIMKNFSLKNWS